MVVYEALTITPQFWNLDRLVQEAPASSWLIDFFDQSTYVKIILKLQITMHFPISLLVTARRREWRFTYGIVANQDALPSAGDTYRHRPVGAG